MSASTAVARGRPRGGRLGLRVVALGYLIALLVLPVGLVFWRALEPGIGEAWASVTTPEAMHAFWLTMIAVLIAVPANTVFGIAAAMVLVRHGRFFGRGFL